MEILKTFLKYIIWIVSLAAFSALLIYIGLNSTYKNIEAIQKPISQINVEIAQATTVNGKIYGKVTNTEENYINDKYIRVEIFNKRMESMGTKYLKIEDLDVGRTKLFAVNFTAQNIKYYTIDIVEDSVKTAEEAKKAEDLYKDIFTKEELKQRAIIGLLLYMLLV